MKAKTFLVLPAFFVGGWSAAQTNVPVTNAPPPHVAEVPQPEQPAQKEAEVVDNLDPAKIAEFQKRFDDGYALQQQGQLAEARKIYDGILAEDPKAKRSLLEAGRISFKLGELARADDYLSQLHEIVPDFPEAIELLIQINQALKHDVKVELLIRDFSQLRDSDKVAQLKTSLCFVRERIHSDQQDIVVSQFFDYTADPNTVWMAEAFDPTGVLKRRILLNFDPDATRALRAKDDKYAHTQVFTWFEHILKDGQVKEIDAYLQIFALPDYQKFRSAMFVILANPPKPIYAAPVGAPAQ
jgi:tetratricopeptide (TPR) repeat protein